MLSKSCADTGDLTFRLSAATCTLVTPLVAVSCFTWNATVLLSVPSIAVASVVVTDKVIVLTGLTTVNFAVEVSPSLSVMV